MTLDKHPFGKPYYHIPTGKVIYLVNGLYGGKWRAHYQYRDSMVVRAKDLRLPMIDEILKDYPNYNGI